MPNTVAHLSDQLLVLICNLYFVTLAKEIIKTAFLKNIGFGQNKHCELVILGFEIAFKVFTVLLTFTSQMFHCSIKKITNKLINNKNHCCKPTVLGFP